jgi:hypothetical protein
LFGDATRAIQHGLFVIREEHRSVN